VVEVLAAIKLMEVTEALVEEQAVEEVFTTQILRMVEQEQRDKVLRVQTLTMRTFLLMVVLVVVLMVQVEQADQFL